MFKSYKLAEEIETITSATTKVSIVCSDDTTLDNPTPRDNANIEYPTIEDMVRKAVELCGGFNWLIQSGDMVLLKPNIVDPEPPGSGEITDVRVIKALIKIIDEIDPGNIEIVVGEGAPRPMDYEMAYQNTWSSPRWQKLWDVAGYQDLLTDPYLEGINFRLSNLNGSPPENPWQDLVLVDVPGGGEALPQGGQYYIHKDVLDADVFITVPVMKIHTPGITVALKNQIGLAPSTIYGFSKDRGVPQNSYQYRLTHGSQAPKWWTDKEIVDLTNLANIQFAVVDAIACLEKEKSARRSGGTITNLVRMNMIVAGPDPVAVDHVCTRLMGMNPDDIEHITLAERVGLGTNNPDDIEIVGANLEESKRRFRKSSSETGDFGQSNREWLLKGPFPIAGISEPMDHEFITDEASVAAHAGIDDWSEAVYFTDDRIDLGDYFDLSYSDDVVSYAFSYFDAPKDQEAELWIGSDEALKVYINGEVVYNYSGTRSFPNSKFLSAKVKANIKAGENRLLVKSLQKYGRYDFCLNICEPESDPSYDGNRIWGLKFKTKSQYTAISTENTKHCIKNFVIRNAYPNPFNNSVTISFVISKKKQNISIVIYNLIGKKVRTLISSRLCRSGENSVRWDARNDEGRQVCSGTYIAVMTGSEYSIESKKLVLLK
ncbi:MAG: DUF362 domain-containing protein [candidate division KSB1 bacterium]|nr:DUF362 domain-containing protein [candidate division KSB1 bacterium]